MCPLPNVCPEGNRPLGKYRHLRRMTTSPCIEIIVVKFRKDKTGWRCTRIFKFLKKVMSTKGSFTNYYYHY
jgi:hypothetical protein